MIFQKTRPCDGFSFMTGTIPLPPDCTDTSNPIIISENLVVLRLEQSEVHHQLPKLMAGGGFLISGRRPVVRIDEVSSSRAVSLPLFNFLLILGSL